MVKWFNCCSFNSGKVYLIVKSSIGVVFVTDVDLLSSISV